MFGKLNVGRDGETGQAVVMRAERHGGMSTETGRSAVTYDLELRASFDDGSTIEFSERVGNAFHSAGAGFSVGDVVPVRYDPGNHKRIEVDVPAIRDRNAANQRTAEEMASERAERIADRLAQGKLPPLKGSEALNLKLDMDRRLKSGEISQEQFDAELAELRERQSV